MENKYDDTENHNTPNVFWSDGGLMVTLTSPALHTAWSWQDCDAEDSKNINVVLRLFYSIHLCSL